MDTTSFETALMLWLHRHSDGLFTPVALTLHYLGKTAAASLLTVLAAWLLGRHLGRKTALFVIAAPLAAALNMWLLKICIQRPRPMLWPRLVEEHGFSFPSGHSTFAAAAATVAVLLCRRTRLRTPAVLAAAAFALLMGYSRVWLGVHYPSDVLAGWLNGTAVSLLVYTLIFRHKPS